MNIVTGVIKVLTIKTLVILKNGKIYIEDNLIINTKHIILDSKVHENSLKPDLVMKIYIQQNHIAKDLFIYKEEVLVNFNVY